MEVSLNSWGEISIGIVKIVILEIDGLSLFQIFSPFRKSLLRPS